MPTPEVSANNSPSSEDLSVEKMSPLAVAAEFNRICKMLDGRRDDAQLAREDYWASGKRIYEGNPTEGLAQLIGTYYAGTPTAKARLLSEGFIEHGYNEGDMVSDTPYGQWPRELGIDIERGNPGAFEKEGARRLERRDLLVFLLGRISIALDPYFKGAYLGEALALTEAFLKQGEEYEKLFGEPYDTPWEEDSDHEKKEIEKAAGRRKRAESFLQNHPQS